MKKEEIPKCNSCGQPIFEVGEIGTWVDYGEEKTAILVDKDNKSYGENKYWEGGRRLCKLYQCPECKDVKIY